MRTFVQILMAVLALGVYAPQPVCASGSSEPGKICCCTGTPVCHCHPGTPCKKSCALVKVQALDKQVSNRVTFATSPGFTLLFAITRTRLIYPVLAPVFRPRESDASPPFGGSPPQSVMCLWRI